MATKLKVNYEFVGDSTTPVTRTNSIKHGDKMLDNVINTMCSFVTPEMFGAKHDGVTDDFTAIANTVEYARTHNKSRIYLSPGHYIVSDTINIPSNIMFYGDGSKTIIDVTDTSQITSGEVIVVCGDNVIIKDLFITFSGWNNPLVTGSIFGCIGISNMKYSYGVSYNTESEDRTNVSIINVNTDKYYLVQTETRNGYSISNVLYRDLKGNSLISINPSPQGTISNMIIENCTGGYLRIGTGSGNLEGCRIIGGEYSHIRTTLPCFIDDVFINNSDDNIWNTKANIALDIASDGVISNNVLLKGGNSNVLYGIYVRNTTVLTNVVIDSDYVTRNVNDDTPRLHDCKIVNCNFGTTKEMLTGGMCYNTVFKRAIGSAYPYCDKTERVGFTLKSGAWSTGYFPISSSINGKVVTINLGGGISGGFSHGDTLATIDGSAYFPDRDIAFVGVGGDDSTLSPIIATVKTDGRIVLDTHQKTFDFVGVNISYEI